MTALLLLVAMGIYGGVRLALQPTRQVATKLRIMQPNLPQDARFNYSAKAEVMQKYLSLSDRATGPQSTGVRDVNILIWPESALPFFLTREPDAMADIANLLPVGTVLITGAARADEPDKQGRILRGYNSVYVIDHDGTVLSVYDKVHLVPFGEYVPFADLLGRFGLEQLVAGPMTFAAGNERHPITLPGGKLGIEWREHDDHVLMTGTADFEYEGRFDPALFASVA